MDRLGNQTSIRNVREALESLPSKLNETYEDAMIRIQGLIREHQQLAISVLSWTSKAVRPLRIVELQHALATRPGDKYLDEEGLQPEALLVSVCAGLVTIDPKSKTIGLVHFTVEEYFKLTQQRWFPDADKQLAISCLVYLSFEEFEKGYCCSDEEFESRLRKYRFYDYAARSWGIHAHTKGCDEVLLAFLKDKSKTAASGQAILISDFRYPGYSQRTGRNVTGLHLAAYFGLESSVATIIGSGIDTELVDSRDSNGLTPLSWAADIGHEAVVRLLLDTGTVDADSKDNAGWTPLWRAAENGHEAVVRLLLDTGTVDADSKDSYGLTPLSLAAKNGHEAVVRLLEFHKLVYCTGICTAPNKKSRLT